MITSIENMFRRGSLAALALALVMSACGDDDGGDDDDKPDTGTSGDASTAKPDAATGLDATVDAAGPKADASTPTDSGARDAATTTPDATVVDSGVDAGTDSGATATIPTLNGCAPTDYVDQSTTGNRTVTFGTNGFTYSPKCLTIAAGQKVTFSGNFGTHPLAKGTSDDANAGSPNNPITDGTGSSKEVTFPTAGTYPYVCTRHKPGMVGSIHVK